MPRFSGTLVEQPQQATGPRFRGTPVEQPAAAPAPAPADPQAFEPMIIAAAQKYQLDPRLLRSQMMAESSGNPAAVSPKGARGLFQHMPATAAELGIADPHDPAQSIEGGAKYMRQLLDRYKGNTNAALAAYNWGMGNVDRQGLSKMPAETRDYISKIRGGMGDPDVPYPDVAPDNPREEYRGTADLEAQIKALGMKPIKRGGEAEYWNQRAAIAEEYKRRTGKNIPGAWAEDIARGFQQGMFEDPIAAVKQIADFRWLVPDAVERKIDKALGGPGQTTTEQEVATEKGLENYRKSVGEEGVDVGRLVGNIVNPASLATGAAGAVPGWVQKLGPKAQQTVMAAIRGGTGAATAPVDPEATGGIAGQKAAQLGAGAIAGPIAEGIGRGLTNVAGRGAGAIADRMASEEVEKLVGLSRQWGIDLLGGDYDTNRKVIRGLEARLINAQVPGLAIDLRKQQQQGMEAAQKLLGAQSKQLQSMTFASIDKIRDIAAGGGKRAAEAQAVLRMAEEAGTDARRMIQASGNMKWLRMKLGADELYDQVERLAGNADVPPTKTLSALDNLERRMTSPGVRAVDYSQDSARLVQKWRSELDISPDNLPDGTTAVPANTYMRMRDFLTDIEKRIDDATQPGGLKSDALWLKDVAKAVRADMESFAQSKPALAAANARANKFYQDHVVPFQADTMAKALKSDNPDQVWSAFVRQGAGWRGDTMQQKLYKALDEKGKAAVRAGIVEDAFRQATDPEHFSPVMFNKVLRQTGYESFFSGAARSELDGLLHIMDRIARSDPQKLSSFQPMVGTIVGASALGGAMVAPGAVAGALAGTGALKWLVTSDKGRRILYSANLLKPGVPGANEKWARLLDDMNKQFGSAAGVAAGREAGNEGSVIP